MHYALLDSGNQLKLEQFGKYKLVRPCAQALWKPDDPQSLWHKADASFSRENGNRWHFTSSLPASWIVSCGALRFKISLTDFGHLGIFPEHELVWTWAHDLIKGAPKSVQVLNLFAYSGGATLSCAQAGAEVCHLDASKGMVSWARENALLNQMDKHPIRWIVDDAFKFLKRELNRGRRYDGIILDPPTFGRGSHGEIFQIETHINELLELCFQLLSASPLFVVFTSHTPGMSPLVMHHLLEQMMAQKSGTITSGELMIKAKRPLPSGSFARWQP